MLIALAFTTNIYNENRPNSDESDDEDSSKDSSREEKTGTESFSDRFVRLLGSTEVRDVFRGYSSADEVQILWIAKHVKYLLKNIQEKIDVVHSAYYDDKRVRELMVSGFQENKRAIRQKEDTLRSIGDEVIALGPMKKQLQTRKDSRGKALWKVITKDYNAASCEVMGCRNSCTENLMKIEEFSGKPKISKTEVVKNARELNVRLARLPELLDDLIEESERMLQRLKKEKQASSHRHAERW